MDLNPAEIRGGNKSSFHKFPALGSIRTRERSLKKRKKQQKTSTGGGGAPKSRAEPNFCEVCSRGSSVESQGASRELKILGSLGSHHFVVVTGVRRGSGICWSPRFRGIGTGWSDGSELPFGHGGRQAQTGGRFVSPSESLSQRRGPGGFCEENPPHMCHLHIIGFGEGKKPQS
ncbi:hypothetical protein CRENBAI_013146 [Crenichthys baileyi]|uniref:Uncharacterized protein n=1 Tax=Crenichthys baileyi TaxID=28760 RepID=A0AAV9S505_9TELE